MRQARQTKVLGKIAPIRIDRLDQLQFPAAIPLLDTLFAQDRLIHRLVRFESDERAHAVLTREAGQKDTAVFVDA